MGSMITGGGEGVEAGCMEAAVSCRARLRLDLDCHQARLAVLHHLTRTCGDAAVQPQ